MKYRIHVFDVQGNGKVGITERYTNLTREQAVEMYQECVYNNVYAQVFDDNGRVLDPAKTFGLIEKA